MRSPRYALAALAVLTLVIVAGAVLLGCAASGARRETSRATQLPGGVTPTVSDWQALLNAVPVAHTTPLPAPAPSPLDGTYAKLDPSWPQWWACRRCADYRPAGGIWKLQFDKGVMRILYDVTGWRSLGSFTVSGDRLYLFNDPYCPEVVGEYAWQLEGGQLQLRVVGDSCSFQLRGKNLRSQPWLSCPSADGSPEPPGCADTPPMPPLPPTPDVPVIVAVHGGDSRFFPRPPDVRAQANTEDRSPPPGIRIAYSRDSIPYGLNRILWWNGDWIEASGDVSAVAMGVQFLGEPQMGWARVLFDGVEVWRGNTSAIWNKNGRHGGYIEVSGFPPGTHTIRAESLGFDYHPVTVASFGFSYDGGVESQPPAAWISPALHAR